MRIVKDPPHSCGGTLRQSAFSSAPTTGMSLFLVFPLFALADPLPSTAPLEFDDIDLSGRIMDGAHTFVERKIAEAASVEVIAGTPEELAEKLGVIDERLAPSLEFISSDPVGPDGSPSSSLVAEGPGFQIHQVRWQVLEGFFAEGLYVNPTEEISPPAMVLMPDADNTPEDILGLSGKLLPEKQIGLRFASCGFRMLIPAPLNREKYEPSGKSDQTHREWIYRQAFQMGRHPLGYEIQEILSAIDWFEANQPGSSISVAGYGEGGRVAFYAAAIDSRIDNCFVSGAVAPRITAWSEPIYRNVFGLLPNFSDAAVGKLISPRNLLVEHTEFPDVTDQKGEIKTPDASAVEKLATGHLFHEPKTGHRADYPSVAGFLQKAGIQREVSRVPPVALLIDLRNEFDSAKRHQRIFEGMQNHVQSLVDRSDRTREEFYFYNAEPSLRPGKWSTEKEHETLVPSDFIINSADFREQFAENVIGRFDEELAPPNPRSKQIIDSEKWTAWDVVLDVYPDFQVWGVLLLPKGMQPDEKRPVVVCQHGRNGVPRDTIDAGKSAYNDFAAELADRGFIVFSPHNLYRGEDRYRWLDRKANLIGCSLFSFITASHEQILTFLKNQPNVDPDRIAFYGLSYGGETAVRVPALLTDYCLSICSGDFNQWTRKVADPDFPNGFMDTNEWEMPYWNMGNTFDYAELAGLIFPRPFFVERGHHDRVSTDEWVAHEYAKVRALYAQFGLADQTGIEFFQGGHSINGEGAFDFLHRHLEWDGPRSEKRSQSR